MTIAIVGGTGPEGSGLALRWARAGQKVIIGSRSAERATAAASSIAERIGGARGRVASDLPQGDGSRTGVPALEADISGADNTAACAAADIVILTVPFDAHAETLKHLKPSFRPGQILVDATVPLAASVGGKPTRTLGVWQGSAAQQAAELVPDGVVVVAAFHNVSAELLNIEQAIECDVIVCSDDKEAAKKIRNLARKIPGIRAIDGGKLENARIVEQITALLIGLNIRHKGHSGIRITGLPLQAYDI
ncbi:MAG TPA: NADPH-dependent F420 reductase [Terriglobales bacterium]|nr:NADPH-dependent F420 reductase [Terriglobales bacterium]